MQKSAKTFSKNTKNIIFYIYFRNFEASFKLAETLKLKQSCSDVPYCPPPPERVLRIEPSFRLPPNWLAAQLPFVLSPSVLECKDRYVYTTDTSKCTAQTLTISTAGCFTVRSTTPSALLPDTIRRVDDYRPPTTPVYHICAVKTNKIAARHGLKYYENHE